MKTITVFYLDNRFRQCPSFKDWRAILAIWTRLPSPQHRAQLETEAVNIAKEFEQRAYIAGPKGQLP